MKISPFIVASSAAIISFAFWISPSMAADCSQSLDDFSDGQKSQTIIIPPQGGFIETSLALPTDSKVCSASLEINRISTTGNENETTAYLWVPSSGGNQLIQIRISDATIVHTFSNGSDNCAGNAFSNPSRITVIQGGEVWVGNRDNGTVTRLGMKNPSNPSLGYECKGTYADVGGAPRGITYDAKGDIWVADNTTDKICKYQMDGTLIGCADSGCKSYGAIGDSFGNVWLSDRTDGKLCKCSGNISCSTAATLTTEAYGIGIDNNDNIWVVKNADTGEFCKYDQTAGNLTCGYFTGAGGGWGKARGIAVDIGNSVWVAASSDNTIHKFDQNGNQLCQVNLGMPTDAVNGQGPIGMAIDSNDYVWAVYHDNPGRVYKIDQSCNIIQTINNVGAFPYNYSDMTGLRTPKIIFDIGGVNPVSISSFPDTVDFTSELNSALRQCSGGTPMPSKNYCGNDYCQVKIKISSIFTGGSYTLGNLDVAYGNPTSKFGGGLVTCGRNCDDPNTDIDETAPCSLCHLFVMIKRVIDFTETTIVSMVFILMMVLGGFILLTSQGDPARTNVGRGILQAAIIGAIVTLAAWLIIDTVITFMTPASSPLQSWNTISCEVTFTNPPQ